MTFGWRTVALLEGDVLHRFSGSGLTQRHTIGSNGRVRQLMNASWRQVREIAAFAMDPAGSYTTRTATLTLPTTAAVTGETYARLDFPTDAIGVYAVRCLFNAGERWKRLRRMSLDALLDVQNVTTSGYRSQPRPVGYHVAKLPDGVGQTETAGDIFIAPIPTSGSYALWYLQGWQDRTNDLDVIPGAADHIEYMILDTCIKMAQPDSDSNKQLQTWMMERARIKDAIEDRGLNVDAGPIEPRDARGDGDEDYWGGEW